MKIYFSPYYDGTVFLGDSPKVMGESFVGNMGLLDQLQLRLGLHIEPKADVERDADYLKAMAPCIPGTLFEKAAEVDPMGTASKLLQWRDALIMAGWDGTCQGEGTPKLVVLANIECGFHSMGVPDCWREIVSRLNSGEAKIDDIDSIQVDCPRSEIPQLIVLALEALAKQGVQIIQAVKDGPEVTSLPIDKVRLVEFADVNDAYEWFATAKEMPADTAVINRDNVQLDHTLYTWNQPQVHASMKNSNPQLLQLFKLSMSIFARPLNVQNLVSYLLLPVSPIPGALRRKLARGLLKDGGFGDSVLREDGKCRDNWEETIANFEFVNSEGNPTPQAKANKMPFLEPMRKDYKAGIAHEELSIYIDKMKQWARVKSLIKDLSQDLRGQYNALTSYFTSLSTAIQTLGETINYQELEKLILQIYRPMTYKTQNDEVGAGNVIDDIRAMAIPAKTLIWLDCQEEDREIDPYDFLNRNEREYLSAHGCVVPDFGKHLKCSREERLRLISLCEEVILVSSKFNGSTRLSEHSVVAEAKHAYKIAGSELKPTPAFSVLQSREVVAKQGQVETLSPVLALELGPINYPGRKESNSSIDTLVNLPFNYVMQYVAKLPKPDDEQTANAISASGLVAHHFFQHLIEDANNNLDEMRRLTHDEFEERLEKAIDAKGLVLRQAEFATLLNSFHKQLKDSMLGLIEIMETKQWKVEGCEIAFPADENSEFQLEDIGNFGARIDFLLKQGDQYVIIDFKRSYSKKYAEKLESNTALQLELYKQTVETAYPGKNVVGVGYYLMPLKQLITTDIEEIPNSKLIRRLTPKDKVELFDQIKHSFEFRMKEIKSGHIEEGETMDFSNEEDSYIVNTEAKGLCPLKTEEKTPYVKKSETIYNSSKKPKFESKDLVPQEIATSYPILKGRLK